MPVVAFHGTDDELVPFEGGPGGRLGLPVTGVRGNMRDWAEHNGCNLTLQTERIAEDVVLESYGGCADGAGVHLYVIEGGGHTWPGASRDIALLGETTQSISATEIAWRFLLRPPQALTNPSKLWYACMLVCMYDTHNDKPPARCRRRSSSRGEAPPRSGFTNRP